MKVAGRHNKWIKQRNKLSRANWAHVRGFKCDEAKILEMSKVVARLQSLLRNNVFHVLERWLRKALQAQDMETACVVHAHLIYVFKNTEPEEYNFTTVSVMVTSQVFLTSRYRYNVEAGLEEEGKGRSRSKTFHTIIRCIYHKLNFFYILAPSPTYIGMASKDKKMSNEVMESIVRVSTLTGTRTDWNTQKMADSFKNRNWLEMTLIGAWKIYPRHRD